MNGVTWVSTPNELGVGDGREPAVEADGPKLKFVERSLNHFRMRLLACSVAKQSALQRAAQLSVHEVDGDREKFRHRWLGVQRNLSKEDRMTRCEAQKSREALPSPMPGATVGWETTPGWGI